MMNFYGLEFMRMIINPWLSDTFPFLLLAMSNVLPNLAHRLPHD